MAINDKQPSRRSLGAHSASRRSASSDRDSAPQYRTRNKGAKTAAKDAAKNAEAAAKSSTGVIRDAKPAARTAPSKRVSAGNTAAQKAVKGQTATGKRVGAGSTAAQRAVSNTAAQRAISNTAAQRAVGGTASQHPVNGTDSQNPVPMTGSTQRIPGNTAAQKALQAQKAQQKGGQTKVQGNAIKKPAMPGIPKLSNPAGDKTPASRTSSNSAAFKSFFKKNLKFCLPVAFVLLLLVVGGVFDIGASFGKIHPGVKVQGIEVGGMTKEDASAKLVDELSSQLADSRVTIYTTESAANQDGATVLAVNEEDEGGIEKANAAEISATDMDGDGKNDKWTVTSESVGSHIDGDAMAEEAFMVGREGNFVIDRVKAWFGAIDLNPILGFNNDLLNTLVDEIDKACGKQIKDCKISISAGKAKAVKGHDGWLVNKDKVKSCIAACTFGGEATAFVAPMETQTMRISMATAKSVAKQVTAALKEDIVIKYDGEKWKLDEYKLGDLLSQTVLTPEQYLNIGNGTQKKTKIPDASADPEFVLPYDTSAGLDENSGYTLQCYVNQEKATDYLAQILGKKAQGGARNARFDTSSGDEVKIVKSKNGKGPDRNAAALQMQDMLFGTDTGRTIKMVDTVIVPERTTKDAKAMGIKERLASWSIGLSGTSSRIKNIRLLCKLIDGSIVAPGETWSFNETTGERTEDKGFEAAPVIVNGKHEDQLGGGVCQVATCVFNAVCFSGLGIVTRTNHDFYIPTYDDEGFADATVSWDVPDLAWLNDTDNYILLTADASGNDVVVSLWGTDDGRQVTCDRGEWKAGAKYKTIRENDDTLEKGVTKVEQTGVNGRSIQIHYLVTSKKGDVLHDITFNSVYIPQNEIIKVGTKVSSSESSGDDSGDDS